MNDFDVKYIETSIRFSTSKQHFKYFLGYSNHSDEDMTLLYALLKVL